MQDLNPLRSLLGAPGNVLSASGIVLTVIGLLHLPVWFWDGGGWVGQVSWRKPILFGVSTGVTLISIGWLASKLHQGFADRCVAWVVSVCLVLEVALITIQQWRGTASHFNQTTVLNAAIDHAMFALILIAFVGIVYFTARSFSTLRLPTDYGLAVRAGMLFLVVSCCIGFAISAYGYNRVASGLSPEIVGDRGVTKFPHGIAIHALQILPAVVFGARMLAIETAKRKFLVLSLILSFALQIIFASYQTISGLGRYEITTVAGVGLSLVSFGTPVLAIVFVMIYRQPFRPN